MLCFVLWVVEQDKVDVLVWALEHDYELNERFCYTAVLNNSIKILSWALTNSKVPQNLYLYAIQHNRIKVVKWIIENNLDINPVTLTIDYNNTPMIMLLLENGYLNVNTDTCVDLTTSDLIFLPCIEKTFGKMIQCHFKICKNVIMMEEYGRGFSPTPEGQGFSPTLEGQGFSPTLEGQDDNISDQKRQKLIIYNNDGNVNVCPLTDTCWWYLYLYCKTRVPEVKTYAKDKIGKCPSHNIFYKHFL